MKIPDKVKIGAHIYTIKKDDPGGDADARFGHTLFRKLEIYIDDRCALTQQEETFFHEVLHAVCDSNELFTDEKEEERVVQCLGHGIYQVLKENNLLK